MLLRIPSGILFFAKTKLHILFAKVWVSNKSTDGKVGKDHKSSNKGITDPAELYRKGIMEYLKHI